MRQQPSTPRLTVAVPAELLERARNAVYWSPGCTMTRLVEHALRQYLDQLERQHGEPYPCRQQPLKRGRPKLIKRNLEKARRMAVPPGAPQTTRESGEANAFEMAAVAPYFDEPGVPCLPGSTPLGSSVR